MKVMFASVFKRYEEKYVLTSAQYGEALKMLSGSTVRDEYSESLICSLYYDTPDKRLIRSSIEKPVYKEKLRLRCYGVPSGDSACFIELKKKYKGVVYKRRITSCYDNAVLFMNGSNSAVEPSQIKNEIIYFGKFYGTLEPSYCIFYKRLALYDKNDRNIRVTFDSDITARNYDLDLRKGVYGERLTDGGVYIMEIKTAGAIPLNITDILTKIKAYPASFSKYGTAYKNSLNSEKNIKEKGEENCA